MLTEIISALFATALTILLFIWRGRIRARAWRRELGERVKAINRARDDRDIRYEVARQLERLETEIVAGRERQAWLQSILDGAHDGIVVLDAELNLLSANPAAAAIFFQPVETLIGKRLVEVTRDKEIYDAFRAAVVRQLPYDGRVTVHLGADARTFSLRITPLADSRAAGVLLDITRLEELERVRQEFLANVSHELRTPITSIMAYVETLLDGGLHDQENNVRFLEIIRRNVQRLTNLVEDISSLSAIESGNLPLEPQAVDLAQVAAETVAALSMRAGELRVTVHEQIPPGLLIQADRKRFEQVLLNILDNGLKFNKPGGEVHLRGRLDGTEVVLEIEDTGVGISSIDLPRIFERFYRGDKSRATDAGGTGLGLSIVKHLVRAHGAQIDVRSQLGQGSCLTLRWPLAIHRSGSDGSESVR